MASPDVSLVVSTVMISSLELNDKLFVVELLGNGKLPLIPTAGSHDPPRPPLGNFHSLFHDLALQTIAFTLKTASGVPRHAPPAGWGGGKFIQDFMMLP